MQFPSLAQCYNTHVVRRRETSCYQLAFDLAPRSVEETAVYQAILQNLAAGETSRFVRKVDEEVVVKMPDDAAWHLLQKVFVPFDRLDQEELWLLLLSTRNRITHEVMLYRGTLDMVPVRPSEVFKEAVRVNAASVMLAHNHPSGDPSPSMQDVKLTEMLVLAGELLNIPVVDHIVVGRKTWLSLRMKGLGFRQP